jgi:hypothetical protein
METTQEQGQRQRQRPQPPPHATLVQRLAARPMRQRGFSFNQIAAPGRVLPTAACLICRGVASDNVREATLAKLGAPPDDGELHAAVQASADALLARRLDSAGPEAPRGRDPAFHVAEGDRP